MREHVTDALVLRVEFDGEKNKRATLYTRNLGKIYVRVVSGTKITSKLSPHLVPGNLVLTRFVEKNDRYTLADIVPNRELNRQRCRDATLSILHIASSLLPVGVPDAKIWEILLNGSPDIKSFLKHVGYDSRHANCSRCNKDETSFFSARDHEFLCKRCGSQFPRGEVLYVES